MCMTKYHGLKNFTSVTRWFWYEQTADHLENRPVADLHSKILDAPPRGPNSFNFMHFWEFFGKIVCWRPPGELVPPPRGNPGSATASSYFRLLGSESFRRRGSGMKIWGCEQVWVGARVQVAARAHVGARVERCKSAKALTVFSYTSLVPVEFN